MKLLHPRLRTALSFETADGTLTLTWNAEERLTSTAGVSYTYDGDGWRVKKDQTGGTTYDKLQWRSPSGDILFETDLAGANPVEYIYFAGRRVARRDANGTVRYFLQDHLGSTRMIASAGGVIEREMDYYPFGGERVVGTPTADDPHKFAGMYLDGESGLYHTWARMYSPQLGRWLAPDPLHGHLSDPGSLNRYQYVMNNPVNSVDPLGLDCTPEGCYPGRWDTGIYGGDGPPVGPGYGWTGTTSGHTSQTAIVAGMEVPLAIYSELRRTGIGVPCPDFGCGPTLFETPDGRSAWGRFRATLVGEDVEILSPWINVMAIRALGAFTKYAQTQGLDPNQTYDVTAYEKGLVLNISVQNAPQLSVPKGYVRDPFTFTHGGNPSYVQPVFFNGGHLIAEPRAVGYHTDFFGVLNPAHYVEWALGAITGQSETRTFTCSVAGGCH